MPWRGPSFEGEFPSLGWQVLEWVTEMLVVPDGDQMGERFTPTDDQVDFTVRLFRIDPDGPPLKGNDAPGRLFYRRAMWVAPKGSGKSPFGAALCWAAAKGPVRFDGWDSDGDPVGRPLVTPWVQLAATADEQNANSWSALIAEANPDEGSPLFEHYPDIDIGHSGRSKVHMAGGGLIERVTSAAATREGQRVTWALGDELGLWSPTKGGPVMARTLYRNTAKQNGLFVGLTNAWRPGAQSPAEATADAAKSTRDVLCVMRTGPRVKDLSKVRPLRKALKDRYGSSGEFVDFDRLVAEFQDPENDPAELRRFYLNELEVPEDQWFGPDQWTELGSDEDLADSDLITVGFDGSRWWDATALIGCRVSDGLLVALGVWERPEHLLPSDEWEVPRDEVDAVVARTFDRFRVRRFYCDPPEWTETVAAWAGQYGRGRVKEFWTNSETQMSTAVGDFEALARAGEICHDRGRHVPVGQINGPDPLARHVINARKRVASKGHTISKERRGSPLKIDCAVAAVLAVKARTDALKAGGRRNRNRSRVAASF